MNQERCASYYTASIKQESDYPSLAGKQHVDIAIVGGGFTGVATALELAERGYKVAIVEARKVGWGASGRNGGQITGSLSGEHAMLKQMRTTLGREVEEFVWDLRWRGHRIIRNRVGKYDIACDLKHGHVQAAYKQSHLKQLQQELANAENHGMGEQVQWLDATAIREVIDTDIYHGGLRNNYNMHVHPLNLCLGEARAAADLGVLIFEHSPVTEIRHGAKPEIITENGSISADSVLLAGNAYHRLERNKLGGKLFPATLGIVTTAPLDGATAATINPCDLAVYDTRFVLDYYRLTADKRLLFGGGANYSGKNLDDVSTLLRPNLERTFPRLKGVRIDFQWQGVVGITINRIPQLGKLSDNVYYAQGYSGHGIATTHVVGEIMANAISGTLREFDAFAHTKHWRIPFNDRFGNHLLAIGMWYYQLLEKLR